MSPHVCIIGAGVSGLRSAAVLLQHGFQVTMLEARDRIGGRIAQSSEMGPLEVDIGANWVHSTGYNPIVELAKETGTDLHLWRENTLMVDPEGNLMDSRDANDALKTVWQILERATEHSKACSDDIDVSESLYDFFLQDCSALVKEGTISEAQAQTVLRTSEMWGAYVGVRVERQSLKFFFLEDCITGDDCFIPSNYKNIMSKVSAAALQSAEIRLETVMTSVESFRDDQNPTGKVHVRTANGQGQDFDAVLVTSPLGWLKKNKKCISPMSSRLSSAIESVSYGNLEKVLIEFPSSFWEHANDKEDDRISFVHWLSPQYASATNPEAWRLECVCFSAFPAQFRRNILLFYIYGDCSRHVTSMVRGKVGDERAGLLRAFFEPYYSRLPGYKSQECTPLRFLATEWGNDEFAGNGSYCNFQIGMADAAADVITIREGMPDRRIYFAGEHTAPFDGLGTVAGAYNSGEQVAQRIVVDLQPAS